MQLVLSNNRIIAHGENFLSMGGVVINTETGAKYENATIAECNGCPSDIDKVGYEYHAGVFVPCAPFGAGNNKGYVMEVCTDCATPRNSGIAIKDLSAWETLAEVYVNKAGEQTATISFGVDKKSLINFSDIAVVVGAGMELHCGPYGYDNAQIVCNGFIKCVADRGTSQRVEGTFICSEGIVLYSTHLYFEQQIKCQGINTDPELVLNVVPKDFLTFKVETVGDAYVKGSILLKGRKIQCI